VKFCPVLEDNRKIDAERARERDRENSRNVQARPVEKSEEKRKPNNAFAALADDSDSDEETQVEVAKVAKVEVAKVDEFSTLGGGSSISRNAVVRSYSSIAATPADEVRLGALRKAQAAKPVKWVDEVEEVSDSEDEYEEEVVRSVPYVAPTNTAASAPCTFIYTSISIYRDDDDCDW